MRNCRIAVTAGWCDVEVAEVRPTCKVRPQIRWSPQTTSKQPKLRYFLDFCALKDESFSYHLSPTNSLILDDSMPGTEKFIPFKMATPRPVIHVDREEIYTKLEARIKYLQSFLDFTSSKKNPSGFQKAIENIRHWWLFLEDVDALVTDAKYVKALIPAVVNIVYKKLLQYDITARAFQTRSTSFKGPLDDIPTEESPQILHRKLFLRGYLNKLCSDPTKMEFWEYLDKVG